MAKTYTTKAIAEAVGGELIGKADILISRVSHPADVQSGSDLALAMDKDLIPLLSTTQARAAVIGEDMTLEPGLVDACIKVSRPRLAMAKLTNLFAEQIEVPEGIHPSAFIEKGAEIGPNVSIGAFAYICKGAIIGAGSVLHPQCYIGPNAEIGRDALIYAGVRIGSRVRIGARCIIHYNTTIGSDGFSFVTPQLGSVEAAKSSGAVTATNNELVRIASLGAVIIGDDVEIGANTSIDRGTVASTKIGNGTKIDNQVQIGHNVVIGENCMICGRTGIAGSAVIGHRVVLGGGTGVADHVEVGDDVVAMALSGIAGNISPRSVVGGIPAIPRDRLVENYTYSMRIKNFAKKIEGLGQRLDILEQKPKND